MLSDELKIAGLVEGVVLLADSREVAAESLWLGGVSGAIGAKGEGFSGKEVFDVVRGSLSIKNLLLRE